MGSRRVRVMKKLDKSKVEWIISQKRKGVTTSSIAETMNVSARRSRNSGPGTGTPMQAKLFTLLPWAGRKTAFPDAGSTLQCLRQNRDHLGAVRLHGIIQASTGIDIPCNIIHKMLRDEDLASENPKKSRRRKWVRFERTHSNSMWHTDYKLLDDGRWFLCYEDDASRFVTGYGMFEHATTENALAVLDEAIKNHGKPASIMTDRGSQFYANASEAKKKGASVFEKRLVELGIRQILAGVRHPQTNGKLERLHGEIQRKAAGIRGDNDAQERSGEPVHGMVQPQEAPHVSWRGRARGDPGPGVCTQDAAQRRNCG